MRVVSHPDADAEPEAAALWYEQRQPGLGDDFLDEFERTLRRIVAEPERWRKIRRDNRKLNFHRFPYALVYSVRADAIYLKAVMHLHRRPGKTVYERGMKVRRKLSDRYGGATGSNPWFIMINKGRKRAITILPTITAKKIISAGSSNDIAAAMLLSTSSS